MREDGSIPKGRKEGQMEFLEIRKMVEAEEARHSAEIAKIAGVIRGSAHSLIKEKIGTDAWTYEGDGRIVYVSNHKKAETSLHNPDFVRVLIDGNDVEMVQMFGLVGCWFWQQFE